MTARLSWKQRLNRHWRLHATAFAFTSFGVGAVVLGFTWFPLLRLVSWSEPQLRRRARLTLHHAFRLFVGLMRHTGLVSYELHGRERLLAPVPPGGRLIIANHPSLIDVVLLVSFLPEVDCIVKKALWRNPFLRWPVVWAGYIPNDEGEALVANCARVLKAGRALLVFPEGTRSRPGQPLEMRRGAAQVALAAGCEILPVSIICQPSTLTKAEKWWNIPPRRAHWNITVEPSFRASEVIPANLPPALAARRLSRYFQDFFTVRIGAPAAQNLQLPP